VIANISNPDMVVEDIARHMGMSRTALYSMMKGVAEVTPVDFIKQVRIKQALLLLDKGGKSISEVAYAVGFSDPKYFSRCFKAEMDMTPTQYLDWRHVQEN
ncbi:MAG: helix-turn-helix transcriptional regulator, partial [Duncaniella sp.]|nr:helix-turn-helix transcriptional regulator [Duncaniella sp.]